LTEEGNVGKEEAYRVFNMGVGMVWFVPQDAKDSALDIIRGAGFTADVIGEVVAGKKDVQVI
jgi:phosphoribosylformylglycinamidine cyclo-ligase